MQFRTEDKSNLDLIDFFIKIIQCVGIEKIIIITTHLLLIMYINVDEHTYEIIGRYYYLLLYENRIRNNISPLLNS